MNITKRDVLELRRRLTKNGCSFTRMAGCYVGGNQNRIVQFAQPFLGLADEEFHKYLEIARKVISGTPGGNLLELSLRADADADACRSLLLALRDSGLKNDGLLERFYEQVIAHHQCAGNYLILLFHDIYDVPVRAEDHAKLDESEEVYTYLLCAICPVELSKPGLGYLETENRFGPRIRDWVVGLPEIGFLYPAFSDRSSDLSAIMYYVKPGKNSQPELVQEVLGCSAQRTAAEEKQAFQSIVKEAFGTEQEQAQSALLHIQKNLHELVATRDEDGLPPIELTAAGVRDVLSDVEIPTTAKEQIAQTYEATFHDTLPYAQNLVDSKLVQAGIEREATLAHTHKIASLEQQLANKEHSALSASAPSADDLPWDSSAPQIVLQVPTEKASRIQTQVIDGQKCLVIPVDDGESARINGVAESF